MALKDYRPMMERCSDCLGCKWSPFDKIQSQRFGENCPSSLYYKFFIYSARGKFQAAQGLLDNDYGYTADMLQAATSCTACGACDTACKICRYNLEPLEHNLALKNDAVERGNLTGVQRETIKSLEDERTMLTGKKKASRAAWAEGLGLADAFAPDVDTVFFPGCQYCYDEGLRDEAATAVKLLQKTGLKLGYMGAADMCCASRAYQQGLFAQFEKQAENNIKAFASAGVKTIITPCADCLYAFRRLYAAKRFQEKEPCQFEVLHVIEYLDRLLSQGKLAFTKPVELTVTYHDPCHLGRLGEPFVPWEGGEVKIFNQVHTWNPRRPRYNGAYGVYDPPRRVLNAIPGLKLVEMERIREYSFCCGAGGGCRENDPGLSQWTAGERVTEAASTGAQALATLCPWCEKNLKSARGEHGETINVVNTLCLAAQAL
jgi:Fe-S oxidoreductase